MALGRTIAMGVLAGATALTLTAPQAEARNGRHAALIGGLALGAIAGAAIANGGYADGDYGFDGDVGYRVYDGDDPGPRYQYYRSYQPYAPPVLYHVGPRHHRRPHDGH